MDIMVKHVGCGPELWVVLLKISWAWKLYLSSEQEIVKKKYISME